VKRFVTLLLAASSLAACERLVPMAPKEADVMTGSCKTYKAPMYLIPSFHFDMRNACVSKEIPPAYRRADNWPQKS